MGKWAALLCVALGCGFAPAAEPRSFNEPPSDLHRECVRAASDVALASAIQGAVSLLSIDLERARNERLAGDLRTILTEQERVARALRSFRDEWIPPLARADVRLGEALPVTLSKGSKWTLRHTIAWRQYLEYELEITVTASDPSLVVPPKLLLEFEKHQFRFEYEIQAGAKAGDFTITLKPARGESVIVKVTVK